MTRAERLKRLAALEKRLHVRRAPRCYLRCANTGEWYSDGPPGGAPRPEDTVLEIVWVAPTGEYGGRPLAAAELAERRATRQP